MRDTSLRLRLFCAAVGAVIGYSGKSSTAFGAELGVGRSLLWSSRRLLHWRWRWSECLRGRWDTGVGRSILDGEVGYYLEDQSYQKYHEPDQNDGRQSTDQVEQSCSGKRADVQSFGSFVVGTFEKNRRDNCEHPEGSKDPYGT